MIDGTYEGEMMGYKGIVTLTSSGTSAKAVGKAMGQTITADGTTDGTNFEFKGSTRVLFKKIDFEIHGTADGKTINATGTALGRTMNVTGTAV